MNLIGSKILVIWYGQSFGLVKLQLVELEIFKIGRKYHAVWGLQWNHKIFTKSQYKKINKKLSFAVRFAF